MTQALRMLKSRGFTLIELMITLVIVGILMGAGLITLRGYLPKQRLLATVSALENTFQRAQSDATVRSKWTCVKFENGNTMKLYVDSDAITHGASDACGSAGDVKLTTQEFKRDIVFPTCSGFLNNCVIWFDATGVPKACNNTINCGISTAISACTDHSYEAILTNPNLEAGTRAREVEVLSGGLIQTVKPGEKGLITTKWAQHPNISGTGCE